jgi:hypothetical protein
MLNHTINKIKETLDHADHLSAAEKKELLEQLNILQMELTELAKTEKEHAHSIANFAHLFAHESLRSQPDPELLEISNKGLKASIRKFEATHPRLAEIILRLSTMLGV